MKSPRRSTALNKLDIAEFYAINIKVLWRGFKQEHISFQLLCVYFFFEYVRPQAIYTVIDVVPYAQITLLATMGTLFFDRKMRWVSNTENKLLIFFSIIVILSSLFAFRPTESLEQWVSFTNWVIVYFLVVNIVNSEQRLIVFLLLYFLFSFKMAQHGFVTWAQRGFSFASYGLVGAGAFFRNSGEFAIQMIIYSTLSAAFILGLMKRWGRYKKLFFYLMPITGLGSVLGSSTRGAQLALAVILVWLLVKCKAGLKTLLLILAIGLIGYFLIPDEQIQRFREIGDDKSSQQRLVFWEIGLQIIREKPVLGVGYKNWLAYTGYLYPYGVEEHGPVLEPHNIFIQAAAELGLIGLCCYLVMVALVFLLNGRTRKMALKVDNRLLYFLAYGLDAGLIGYLVAGMFVSVFYYPFFWVQMGLSVSVYTIASKKIEESKQFLPDVINSRVPRGIAQRGGRETRI